MSFGFSVGDFFALTQLIWNTSKALSDSAGSKAEYQSLIQTLLTLLRNINSAEELALRCSLGSASSSDPNFVAPLNAIAREREICHNLIGEFMARSEKYTASFIHGGGRAKAVKKLTWRLFHADDVARLERELGAHVDAIQFYTFSLGFQSLNVNLASNTLVLTNIDKRTTSMYNMISQLVGLMPKALGYPWEGGCAIEDRPLQLLDALGRDLKIPTVFLSSPEVFHDMLEIVHRNLPGHRKIKSKEYSLADEDTGGEIIDAKTNLQWSKKVQSGKTVSINMIFQTFSHNKSSGRCPRCRSPTHGLTLEGQRRRCQICQLRFHIFEEIRFEDEKSERDGSPLTSVPKVEESRKAIKSHVGEASQLKRTKTDPIAKVRKVTEQNSFKRIHYIHELVKRKNLRMTPEGSTESASEIDECMENLPSLHQAAAEGDLDFVIRHLREFPAEIESQGGCDSATPLHYAAYQGRQAVAIFLIENGADVDSKDCDGSTPLVWAIELGHISMFKLLLESGADINTRTHLGRTALHFCCWWNQPVLAKYMLDEGYNINILDDEGRPPISHCNGESSEIIRYMAGEGAEINLPSKSLLSPLHDIVGSATAVAVESLLAFCPEINVVDEDGRTPLFLAINNPTHSVEICNLLIKHGASVSRVPNISMASWENFNPIFAAVEHPAILKLLLSAGADTEARNHLGQTPLHDALFKRSQQSIIHLINWKADIHAVNRVGVTPLHYATWLNNPKITKTLLELGAQATATTIHDENPLHFIGSATHWETVQLLAASGADVNASNGTGMTPILHAVTSGNAACTQILIDLGGDASKRYFGNRHLIHFAAEWGHLDCVQVLLGAGAEANSTSSDGTPLNRATWHDHHLVVELLLESGANPLIFEDKGIPLHSASIENAQESARVLLSHHTATEQLICTNSDNETPLGTAARMGNIEMVKLLARHPANERIITVDDIVEYSPNPEFAEKLRKWFSDTQNEHERAFHPKNQQI